MSLSSLFRVLPVMCCCAFLCAATGCQTPDVDTAESGDETAEGAVAGADGDAVEQAQGEADASPGMAAGEQDEATAMPVQGEPAIVRTNNAPLYRYGPAQGSGPDLTLAAGTVLQVTKKGRSYSTILMQNGMSGFMATRDLTFGDLARLASERAAMQNRSEPRETGGGGQVRFSSTARVVGGGSDDNNSSAVSGPQVNAPETPLPDATGVFPEDIAPITPPVEDVEFPSFRY